MRPLQSRYVYFAHDGTPTERVKIGISVNPRQRVSDLKCELLFAVEFSYKGARIVERAFHDGLAPYRLRCERDQGYTEWFEVSPALGGLIEHIRLTRTWPWDSHIRVIV